VLEEYSKMDSGTRILAYKMLLEKFNEKYGDLIPAQKSVLKEYINNVTNTVKLREFVNEQYATIKKALTELTPLVADRTVQIKLTEVITLLNPLDKNQNVKDENIVSLLQYHQLIAELKAIK
jgi:glucan phosphorylase